MKFTIITPTVQRDSLLDCCRSVDQQTYENWEHIVIADVEQNDYAIWDMWEIRDERRLTMRSPRVAHNSGNTPRHIAWQWATGEWVYFLDDDNTLSSPRILEDIAGLLEGVEEKWALFPIFRHGSIFFFDPPRPCYFDTGNAVVRREIAQWPNIDDYASDAVWLTDTLLKHPYKAFPNSNPIMVMPTTSFGQGGGINGQ